MREITATVGRFLTVASIVYRMAHMDTADGCASLLPLLKLSACVDVLRASAEDLPTLLQLQVFVHIAVSSPIHIRDLRYLTNDHTGMLTTMIPRLGEGSPTQANRSNGLDLVSLVDDPVDGRMKIAALTPRGTELAGKLRSVLAG